MEMHQIRYFLALSRTLNFTRAATECEVAQPSLTRAIKKLEAELGGELFRRERAYTHLTELGRRMLPILQQTLDSAESAKAIAQSFQQVSRAPLCLALSQTINSSLFAPFITQISKILPGLEVRISRGSAIEVVEQLKTGEAEISITGPLKDRWERFDAWSLFEEPFAVLVPRDHGLSSEDSIDIQRLTNEAVLLRQHCEQAASFDDVFNRHDIQPTARHLITSESDLIVLVEAGLGIALVPDFLPVPNTVKKISLTTPDLRRDVHLRTVAGRPRSPAASIFLKSLRAADWSDHLQQSV